jgi:tRNA threonylcarbamoyladenosine biosynthesis protein TsaE
VAPRAANVPSAELTRGELQAWGEALGARLAPPVVLSLAGELGAGKTSLVQSIARGYGVTDPVTSPTFALVHQYAAPTSVMYHLDLYRLKGPADLMNIGWDDALSSGALVCVEWPERAGSEMPSNAMAIRLEHVVGDSERRRVIW